MTTKQIKTVAIVSAVVLIGGIVVYASAKNKPTTGGTIIGKGMGTPQSVQDLNNEINIIAGSTGVDKGLISVGDKAFIDAWYKGLSLGNDTFVYNAQNYNTNNGQLFS